MAYASASDVEVELGRPATSAAETLQWEAWLDRVERTIARRFVREGYDLEEQIELGTPSDQDLIDVEVARVVDKIENPNTRQSSYTKSIDDASKTVRYDTGGDPLTLSSDEWTSLLPTSPRRAKAFSIMPSTC